MKKIILLSSIILIISLALIFVLTKFESQAPKTNNEIETTPREIEIITQNNIIDVSQLSRNSNGLVELKFIDNQFNTNLDKKYCLIIDEEKSGIIFSDNPPSDRKNYVIIETDNVNRDKRGVVSFWVDPAWLVDGKYLTICRVDKNYVENIDQNGIKIINKKISDFSHTQNIIRVYQTQTNGVIFEQYFYNPDPKISPHFGETHLYHLSNGNKIEIIFQSTFNPGGWSPFRIDFIEPNLIKTRLAAGDVCGGYAEDVLYNLTTKKLTKITRGLDEIVTIFINDNHYKIEPSYKDNQTIDDIKLNDRKLGLLSTSMKGVKGGGCGSTFFAEVNDNLTKLTITIDNDPIIRKWVLDINSLPEVKIEEKNNLE